MWRSVLGTEPAWSTGHLSVRYWPGGSRDGVVARRADLVLGLRPEERHRVPTLTSVTSVTSPAVAPRPRAFVRVSGPHAEDYLQRMLSNDVAALGPGETCEALLLTAKARLIAPVRVLRRGHEDFLLLTEPELGEPLRRELVRMRFAARCEIEPEEHVSYLLVGGARVRAPDGRARRAGGARCSTSPSPPTPSRSPRTSSSACGSARGRRAGGASSTTGCLPAEAGLTETHVSFTKGCYPGQEPIARLHYRGHANRGLRVLELEGAELPAYDAAVDLDGKPVGRVTSTVREGDHVLALGYVRREVDDGADLRVDGRAARLVG